MLVMFFVYVNVAQKLTMLYNRFCNMKTNISPMQAVSSGKENMKLAGVFLFLIAAATVMGTLDGFNGIEWIRWFMGGFMIVFGSLKLMGIEVFIKVAPLYDLIAKSFRPYKYFYPLIQVFIGILYIIGIFQIFISLVSLAFGLSSLIGMLQILARRGPIKLSYLGNIIRLRFSTVAVLENTIIVVLSTVMLITSIAL